jgi:hypothetical protein
MWQAIVNKVMNSGFHKGGEFLEQLSDYWFLKKDYVPWNWLVLFLFSIKDTPVQGS